MVTVAIGGGVRNIGSKVTTSNSNSSGIHTRQRAGEHDDDDDDAADGEYVIAMAPMVLFPLAVPLMCCAFCGCGCGMPVVFVYRW